MLRHGPSGAWPSACRGSGRAWISTVTGVVAGLPQPFEGGVRFDFDVEQVEPDAARLPRRIALSWYNGLGREAFQDVAPIHAGERWRFTVRLRRPHGSVNPYGFDYESWLLQRAVGATGYVRPGSKRAPGRAGAAPGISGRTQPRNPARTPLGGTARLPLCGHSDRARDRRPECHRRAAVAVVRAHRGVAPDVDFRPARHHGGEPVRGARPLAVAALLRAAAGPAGAQGLGAGGLSRRARVLPDRRFRRAGAAHALHGGGGGAGAVGGPREFGVARALRRAAAGAAARSLGRARAGFLAFVRRRRRDPVCGDRPAAGSTGACVRARRRAWP